MAGSDHAVFYPDGTEEHVVQLPSGGTFDLPEIGRRGDGTPMLAGEAIITWEWGNTIEEALPYEDFLAIVARISASGDLVVRTEDNFHTMSSWTGKTVVVPGHSSDGYHVFGLTLVIDRAIPITVIAGGPTGDAMITEAEAFFVTESGDYILLEG